jgi:Na+-dependent transporters of the SNF family
MANNKTGFTSSFGVVMAAAGSAVGLGNIWRFPYICGQYGGAACLFVYLLFVFLIGMVSSDDGVCHRPPFGFLSRKSFSCTLS